jgi:hypothetical protein
MKKHMLLVLILSLLFCTIAITQSDLTGTWQGKLATSPNEKMIIQFIISKQANGSYGVMLNSPDTEGIRNIAASTVRFVDGKLTVDVASLNGSYSGTVAKGVIKGEWKQAGNTFPLILTPYKKPGISTLKPLLGEWVGEMIRPAGPKITAVFHFQSLKDGTFTGFADIPEQGQSGIPLSDVALEGNEVTLTIAGGQGGHYDGKLIGNKIEGTVKQGGREMKMTLTKGKYEFPGVALPPEDIKRLLGLWIGKFASGPTHTVVWKFEKRTDGNLMGTNAAPEVSPQVLPLTDLSLNGDQLTCKIPAAGAEFTGKLNDDSLSGTFKAGGQQLVLNLKRGTAADLPTTQMDIPSNSLRNLMGRWNGSIGQDTTVLRFERSAGGKITVHLDIVNKNLKDMLVVKASMTGETLVMKSSDGAQINVTLKGNKLDGNLKLNQMNLPVALKIQP